MAQRTRHDVNRKTNRSARRAGFVVAIGIAVGMVSPVSAKAVFESSVFSPSGNYLAARLAGKDRDHAKAAEFYTRTLRTDPNNPFILERAFLLQLSAGDLSGAEDLAKRVVSQDTRNRLARIVLGLRDFREDRHTQARENWQSASLGSIGQLTASMLTAWSFAAEGRTDEALNALDALSSTDSFNIYRIFHSAMVADLGNDDDNARKLYEQAYEQAGSSLRVVQAYGNFLERHGEAEQARKIYETYSKATNDHPLIRDMLKRTEAEGVAARMIPDALSGAAEALFGLASALADESSVDFAIIYSQMTLNLKPEFPIASTLLGDIYEDTKLHADAVKVYRAVPETSPLYMNAQIQIALNLDDLEKLDEARTVLDTLIARYPDQYQPTFTLANILRGHSKFEEASGYYTKVIDLLPEVTERHWTIFYFRGICNERSKNWVQAEADFMKALELQPDQPLVLNYLAYSWIEKRHNLKEAIRMIRKAVELRPNDGYIVDSLGWAYYQLKKYDLAVEELERAVKMRPEDPVINDHLGDAYWQVGRHNEARFQWNHARDLKPEPEYLESILLKIEHGLLDNKAETDSKKPDKS